MRQQISRDLYAYWNALRGERAAPERASFDPGAIRAILPDTFLLAVDAEGEFPLRVAGARVNALWRSELRGASFIDLWRKEDRQSVYAALMSVVDGVAPLVGGARASAPGDAEIDFEFVLLPLRHFGKTHSRVLGAISPIRHAGWIGHTSPGPLEFLSMRVVDTPEAVRFTPPPSRPPRLRLVVCNQEKL